ncbi:hypothetical protein EKK58_06490 [Candidatus Dependentiae bacterium]|nr:MAG: hypothetical protein EKK58_06490 [Candidatus Dependentiae bacterium]
MFTGNKKLNLIIIAVQLTNIHGMNPNNIFTKWVKEAKNCLLKRTDMSPAGTQDNRIPQLPPECIQYISNFYYAGYTKNDRVDNNFFLTEQLGKRPLTYFTAIQLIDALAGKYNKPFAFVINKLEFHWGIIIHEKSTEKPFEQFLKAFEEIKTLYSSKKTITAIQSNLPILPKEYDIICNYSDIIVNLAKKGFITRLPDGSVLPETCDVFLTVQERLRVSLYALGTPEFYLEPYRIDSEYQFIDNTNSNVDILHLMYLIIFPLTNLIKNNYDPCLYNTCAPDNITPYIIHLITEQLCKTYNKTQTETRSYKIPENLSRNMI